MNFSEDLGRVLATLNIDLQWVEAAMLLGQHMMSFESRDWHGASRSHDFLLDNVPKFLEFAVVRNAITADGGRCNERVMRVQLTEFL